MSAGGPSRRCLATPPPCRAAALLLVLVAVAMWLTGCVTVPTKGPIEKIEGQQPACTNCVNIEVSPPGPGDQPLQIVTGYLRATSNYQPNYSVARQFLSTAAAQSWTPEDGVSIYTGTLAANGNTVVLDGTLIGALARDRTYSARDERLRVDFGLVQENGEWRIGTPPAGLMVEQYSFSTFYQDYNVYFAGSDGVLVPDPIYLPSLRNQASIASVLTKALLSGPSTWLKPVVTSAIPAGTALSVDAVPVVDGIAEVALGDQVLALNESQRSVMAAQVLYTLGQVTGIKGVVFTVNQQPLRVPGGDETTFSVTLDAVPPEIEPLPFTAGEQLYLARRDGVAVLDRVNTPGEIRAIGGELGSGRIAVESLAVSVSGTDLAVVTDGGRTLRRAASNGDSLTTVLDGVSDLRRPQFSRFGELWAVGQQGGRQRLWIFDDGRAQPVDLSLPAGSSVTAFKISPDGMRIAIIRTRGRTAELGVARISRADRITINGWRSIDTTQSNASEITRLADVAWSEPTELEVLGAATEAAQLTVFRISQDASRIAPDTEPITWDAATLTVQMRNQAAVVVGRRGQAWHNDSGQWQPLVDGVRAAAYPG